MDRIAGAQFVQQAAAIDFDRPRGQVQGAREFLIGRRSLHHQLQHLLLAERNGGMSGARFGLGIKEGAKANAADRKSPRSLFV